ncbi:MAG: TatD family hydrolase [Candidatus Altiarchaeota archaeon]
MLIDVHCHLDFKEFDADRDAVVERAKDILVVNSTVDVGLVEKGLMLAERYRNVYCMLGFSASELDEDKFARMCKLIKGNRDKIIGLGEIGLDYYWVKDEAGRQVEREHFTTLVKLSRDLKLPAVVHSRDAESECINILAGHKVRAIMHCFSGTLGEALDAIDFGCLISVPTNVVYAKSKQTLVGDLPLESIVLETDAPFLSPVRGQRNEPANVRAAALKVAEIRGVDVSTVEEVTSKNAISFLGIKYG